MEEATMNEAVTKTRKAIPEELLWEIFSRLPIKSLLRLRCGCKRWRSLIEDPYLCNMRLARPSCNEEDALILTSRYGKGASLEFWMSAKYGDPGASPKLIDVQFPKRVNYELQNSCDGLLCFSKDVEDNEAEEEEAFVCNPLKGKLLLVLPPPTAKSPRPYLSSYGLGFDSSINRYKVVRLFVDDFDDSEMGAEVCTVEARSSWRKISSQTPNFLPSRPSLYASGALHWLAMQWPPGFHKVISFDFEKEKFSTTLSQEEEAARFSGGRFELVDLRGYLGVCHHLGAEIEIWRLKDMEKKEWVKECKILIQLIWEIGLGRGQIEVVGVIGDEILLRLEYNLLSYNSKTKAVRVIYTLSEEPQFHILTGSLVSLKRLMNA